MSQNTAFSALRMAGASPLPPQSRHRHKATAAENVNFGSASHIGACFVAPPLAPPPLGGLVLCLRVSWSVAGRGCLRSPQLRHRLTLQTRCLVVSMGGYHFRGGKQSPAHLLQKWSSD